jgi:hypothetical protein
MQERNMHMKRPLEKRLQIVTGIGDNGEAVLEERTFDKLLNVLYLRADRMINHHDTCEKLRPALRKLVSNVVEYFIQSGEIDDYVMTNIMTALATADSHGFSDHGIEDYSTFIRRLNPSDVNSDRYFLIGRAGSINDQKCPLEKIEKNSEYLSTMPKAKLYMFHAFHHARSKDVSRGAPRIPVEDFMLLIPGEIYGDPSLEEAFLDVAFSDGAWELYQRKLTEGIGPDKMVA